MEFSVHTGRGGAWTYRTKSNGSEAGVLSGIMPSRRSKLSVGLHPVWMTPG